MKLNLPHVRRATARFVILAIPAVLANVVAASGWVLWAQGELADAAGLTLAARVIWLAALVLAVTVESIAVYLAYEAHQARMAGDAAAPQRLAAYGIAGLSGAMNYSHWVTVSESLAVVLAGLSAGSPWLWSIRSQSLHRDQLRAHGLVEPRAVRLAKARWILWAPQTWRVLRLAVWYGETDPVQAIERFGVAPEFHSAARTVRRLKFGSIWPWKWSVATTVTEVSPAGTGVHVPAGGVEAPGPTASPPPSPSPSVRAVAAKASRPRRLVSARTPERSFEDDAAAIYTPGMGWSKLATELRARHHKFGTDKVQAEHARLKAAEVAR